MTDQGAVNPSAAAALTDGERARAVTRPGLAAWAAAEAAELATQDARESADAAESALLDDDASAAQTAAATRVVVRSASRSGVEATRARA
jgi:hypothetical protein